MFTFTVDSAAVRTTVEDWRTADLALEEAVIQDALVGAYLNERSLPTRTQARPATRTPGTGSADAATWPRRWYGGCATGRCAARTVRSPGSPRLHPTGWSIRVLPADLYTGQGGVALTLAEYVTEVRAGRRRCRASPTSGGAAGPGRHRYRTPTPSPGAFGGAASQVWTWLALRRVLGEDWLLERAAERALLLAEGRLVEDDVEVDLLNGAAGAVVPLLDLAAATGQDRWLGAAARMAAG